MTKITTYREKPLSMEEFSKLETYAEKCMTIREKHVSKSVPKTDADGNIYGWERDLVPAGKEVFFKSEPDERVMEAIMRPATKEAIFIHITRLSEHKPYGRGASGWQTIVEDLIHDLNGSSEWAIIKACEQFRLTKGMTFFPDTAELVHSIRNLDEQVRWAYAARPSSKKPEQTVEPVAKPSPKTNRRKAKMMGLVAKQVAGKMLTRWEGRFFDAIGKPAYVTAHQPPTHNFGYGEGV